jgi:hypothetical protein
MLTGRFDVLSITNAVQINFFELAPTRAEPTKLPVF